jgi:wyosine [tRNA(Phe)-imidazoG37] synthetase (radical SAM superfamily)
MEFTLILVVRFWRRLPHIYKFEKADDNKMKNWVKESIEFICAKLEKNIFSDKNLKCKVVFGPVRSRRLGLVLGINNTKAGICSYNCVYCPIGKTSCCSVCTNNCLSPYELYFSVKNKLEEIKKSGGHIDYIFFAGSGDPALDSCLSKEILLLREFGYKIAVFTNSALIWNKTIQENLLFADYVSIKLDSAFEDTWLKINCPHQRLRYNLILNGIHQFSKKYQGILTTETTLIKDINDTAEEIEQLGTFLNTITRKASYFITPMYPPAESFAVSPDIESLQKLSGVIKEKVTNSVLLCCPETEEFFATDDFENEFLGLLALHPVGVDAVKHFIKGNGHLKLLNDLIEDQTIKEIDYNGIKYYTENITNN